MVIKSILEANNALENSEFDLIAIHAIIIWWSIDRNDWKNLFSANKFSVQNQHGLINILWKDNQNLSKSKSWRGEDELGEADLREIAVQLTYVYVHSCSLAPLYFSVTF